MRSLCAPSAGAREQPGQTTGRVGVRRNRLGTEAPASGAVDSHPAGRRAYAAGMRIATWNVNSITARLPRVAEWLRGSGTDVLCLQETKVAADTFPADAFGELGYEVAHHGQGRWNGVAVISRVGIDDVERGFPGDPGFPDAETLEARAIGATCGGVRVWSLYVPNGRTPDDPHYAYKLAWFSALTAHLGPQVAASTAARRRRRLQRGADRRRRLGSGEVRGLHARHRRRACRVRRRSRRSA